MTTIQQVLDKKGHEVLSVRPDNAVIDAIKTMADKNVGSVVVIEDGKPVGIFTEGFPQRQGLADDTRRGRHGNARCLRMAGTDGR
jgi:predicted transcriptional regulator